MRTRLTAKPGLSRLGSWNRRRRDPERAARLAQVRAAAQSNFLVYRKLIRPHFNFGWWERETARELQRFFDDLQAGRLPIVLLQTAPQHGKSTLIQDFICWALGKDPTLRAIFASYLDRLGKVANKQLRRVLHSPEHRLVFPGAAILSENAAFVEYGRGSFYNTTVNGSVTGMPADLGILDDPFRGIKDAYSETIRERVWDWYRAEFSTRRSSRYGLLGIMTRWHTDDIFGRLQNEIEGVRVLSFPAIATEDDAFRKAGEALCPDRMPIEFLERQRAELGPVIFSAMYQQSPYIPGGGMFPREAWRFVSEPPSRGDIRSSCLFWDLAATADGGAYTCGVLTHRMQTTPSSYIIEEVTRGQWGVRERDRIIEQTVARTRERHPGVRVRFEEEPGSAGKHQTEHLVRMVGGLNAEGMRPTGDKETRATPFAYFVQDGRVSLVKAGWNEAFIGEAEMFPASTYKDQIDAAAGAHDELSEGGYDMAALAA